MRSKPPLPVDQCMQILAQYQNGARNKALYGLRLIMRVKDIVGLRTVSDVLLNGEIRESVKNADGYAVALDPRAKSLLYVYLVRRFRQRNLSKIDPRTPLFPTVKSDYLSVERLTQILWEMDEKIRRHHASQQLATPLQRRKVSETITHQRSVTEHQKSPFREVMNALQSRLRMLTRPRKEMQVRSNENANGIRTIYM
jgi:hypothetical protein